RRNWRRGRSCTCAAVDRLQTDHRRSHECAEHHDDHQQPDERYAKRTAGQPGVPDTTCPRRATALIMKHRANAAQKNKFESVADPVIPKPPGSTTAGSGI